MTSVDVWRDDLDGVWHPDDEPDPDHPDRPGWLDSTWDGDDRAIPDPDDDYDRDQA